MVTLKFIHHIFGVFLVDKALPSFVMLPTPFQVPIYPTQQEFGLEFSKDSEALEIISNWWISRLKETPK